MRVFVFSRFVRCLIEHLLMLRSVGPHLLCQSRCCCTNVLDTACVRYKTADAVLIADVKERVEVYRCSPSGLSWPVVECILPCSIRQAQCGSRGIALLFL